MALEAKCAKLIRKISRAPDNSRCFDCDNANTSFVVPQFGIFVCNSCSGIHMHHGHRVKSTTMSNFSMHEIRSLELSGNKVAAATYLFNWKSGKHNYTSRGSANVSGWIKTVFTDKSYYDASGLKFLQEQEESGGRSRPVDGLAIPVQNVHEMFGGADSPRLVITKPPGAPPPAAPPPTSSSESCLISMDPESSVLAAGAGMSSLSSVGGASSAGDFWIDDINCAQVNGYPFATAATEAAATSDSAAPFHGYQQPANTVAYPQPSPPACSYLTQASPVGSYEMYQYDKPPTVSIQVPPQQQVYVPCPPTVLFQPQQPYGHYAVPPSQGAPPQLQTPPQCPLHQVHQVPYQVQLPQPFPLQPMEQQLQQLQSGPPTSARGPALSLCLDHSDPFGDAQPAFPVSSSGGSFSGASCDARRSSAAGDVSSSFSAPAAPATGLPSAAIPGTQASAAAYIAQITGQMPPAPAPITVLAPAAAAATSRPIGIGSVPSWLPAAPLSGAKPCPPSWSPPALPVGVAAAPSLPAAHPSSLLSSRVVATNGSNVTPGFGSSSFGFNDDAEWDSVGGGASRGDASSNALGVFMSAAFVTPPSLPSIITGSGVSTLGGNLPIVISTSTAASGTATKAAAIPAPLPGGRSPPSFPSLNFLTSLPPATANGTNGSFAVSMSAPPLAVLDNLSVLEALPLAAAATAQPALKVAQHSLQVPYAINAWPPAGPSSTFWPSSPQSSYQDPQPSLAFLPATGPLPNPSHLPLFPPLRALTATVNNSVPSYNSYSDIFAPPTPTPTAAAAHSRFGNKSTASASFSFGDDPPVDWFSSAVSAPPAGPVAVASSYSSSFISAVAPPPLPFISVATQLAPPVFPAAGPEVKTSVPNGAAASQPAPASVVPAAANSGPVTDVFAFLDAGAFTDGNVSSFPTAAKPEPLAAANTGCSADESTVHPKALGELPWSEPVRAPSSPPAPSLYKEVPGTWPLPSDNSSLAFTPPPAMVATVAADMDSLFVPSCLFNTAAEAPTRMAAPHQQSVNPTQLPGSNVASLAGHAAPAPVSTPIPLDFWGDDVSADLRSAGKSATSKVLPPVAKEIPQDLFGADPNSAAAPAPPPLGLGTLGYPVLTATAFSAASFTPPAFAPAQDLNPDLDPVATGNPFASRDKTMAAPSSPAVDVAANVFNNGYLPAVGGVIPPSSWASSVPAAAAVPLFSPLGMSGLDGLSFGALSLGPLPAASVSSSSPSSADLVGPAAHESSPSTPTSASSRAAAAAERPSPAVAMIAFANSFTVDAFSLGVSDAEQLDKPFVASPPTYSGTTAVPTAVSPVIRDESAGHAATDLELARAPFPSAPAALPFPKSDSPLSSSVVLPNFNTWANFALGAGALTLSEFALPVSSDPATGSNPFGEGGASPLAPPPFGLPPGELPSFYISSLDALPTLSSSQEVSGGNPFA